MLTFAVDQPQTKQHIVWGWFGNHGYFNLFPQYLQIILIRKATETPSIANQGLMQRMVEGFRPIVQ